MPPEQRFDRILKVAAPAWLVERLDARARQVRRTRSDLVRLLLERALR